MKKIPEAHFAQMAINRGVDPGFVPKPERKKRDNEESRIQKAFIAWWYANSMRFGLDYRLLYSVPNGAVMGGDSRLRAIRINSLKAEGMRPGFPDVNLDVARIGLHGLRIEFKKPGENPRAEQYAYHDLLRAQGYCVHVCRSVDEAISVTENYLSQ